MHFCIPNLLSYFFLKYYSNSFRVSFSSSLFNFQGPSYLALLPSAWISYHSYSHLSSTFFTFLKKLFRSPTPLGCLTDLVFSRKCLHILSHLFAFVNTFFQFFRIIFPIFLKFFWNRYILCFQLISSTISYILLLVFFVFLRKVRLSETWTEGCEKNCGLFLCGKTFSEKGVCGGSLFFKKIRYWQENNKFL